MKMPPVDQRTAPTTDLQTQAWNWLRLLTSGDARELDAQRFRRWVKSSPAHQAAYDEVKRRWDAIEPSARELLHRQPHAASVPRQGQGASPLRGRRAFFGAAAAATAAGFAVVHAPLHWWPAIGVWNADTRTATGEQRALALSDRVEVMLNTQTSVRRRTDAGQVVGLDLLAGEAMVALQGGSRAFSVVAGAGSSIAEAGHFDVCNLGGRVVVTCIEGSVRVEHPAGVRQLQPRQQIVYTTDALSAVAGVDPEAVTAWRQGMLVFDRTRLDDAIEEINRYRPGRVVLMNDDARAKPVSGRFAIASLDVALWQLQESFGLKARALPAGVLVLT